MNRFSHIATLTAMALAVATSMHVSAMEKSDPGGCTGSGGSDLCSGSDGGGGPGDPILEKAVQSEGGRLNPEQIAVLKHQLGLDRSWPEQYVTWVRGVAM